MRKTAELPLHGGKAPPWRLRETIDQAKIGVFDKTRALQSLADFTARLQQHLAPQGAKGSLIAISIAYTLNIGLET